MKTKLNLETDVRIALYLQVDGVPHLILQENGELFLNGVLVGTDQVLADALLVKHKPAVKPRKPSAKPAGKPSGEAEAPKRTRKSKKKSEPSPEPADFEAPGETSGARDPNPTPTRKEE